MFDEDNPLHRDDSNFVFTTEGHILSLDREHIRPLSTVRRKLRRVENLQCPAYRRPVHVYDNWDAQTGLVAGIMSRPDIDYVRSLVGTAATREDEKSWSQDGWCEAPKLDLYVRHSQVSLFPDIASQSVTVPFIAAVLRFCAVPERANCPRGHESQCSQSVPRIRWLHGHERQWHTGAYCQ